jgi:hypothetical protein
MFTRRLGRLCQAVFVGWLLSTTAVIKGDN